MHLNYDVAKSRFRHDTPRGVKARLSFLFLAKLLSITACLVFSWMVTIARPGQIHLSLAAKGARNNPTIIVTWCDNSECR